MYAIQEPTAVSIERIVMATDFAPSSERAMAYAKGLAHRFGATLELVNVYDPSPVRSWEAAELDITPEEAERRSVSRLAILASELREEGVRITPLSRGAKRPASALLEIAAETEADLIVAGTQSKNGVERLVLGSTAEQLIRSASCPVLTVGPKARMPQPGPIEFRTVVYANDFSPEATRAAVYALSFAQDSAAHLYCTYVLDDDGRYGETREALDAGFKRALKERIPESAYNWCDPECVVEHGNAARAILDLAKRVEADLIVLGARKSSFWLARVEKGLTPALLAEAECPVLTIC
jgi:nucleotide-binding universal stress UspA family protein